MANLSLPAIWVTGPVHHYIRYSGQLYYLGTAEVTPLVDHRIMRNDVFNDIGGTGVPMQRTHQGEMVVVGSMLNRFSKIGLGVLDNLGPTLGSAGTENRFSRGGLVFGPRSFELWLKYDNYDDAGWRAAGLEPGIYFPQVDLTGKTRQRLGTDAEKELLTFECFPYWIPQASINSVSGNERGWQTYGNTEFTFFTGGLTNAAFVPQ